MLSDKLLSKTDYNCDREIRTLELLKLRFGDANLHNCEASCHHWNIFSWSQVHMLRITFFVAPVMAQLSSQSETLNTLCICIILGLLQRLPYTLP